MHTERGRQTQKERKQKTRKTTKNEKQQDNLRNLSLGQFATSDLPSSVSFACAAAPFGDKGRPRDMRALVQDNGGPVWGWGPEPNLNCLSVSQYTPPTSTLPRPQPLGLS